MRIDAGVVTSRFVILIVIMHNGILLLSGSFKIICFTIPNSTVIDRQVCLIGIKILETWWRFLISKVALFLLYLRHQVNVLALVTQLKSITSLNCLLRVIDLNFYRTCFTTRGYLNSFKSIITVTNLIEHKIILILFNLLLEWLFHWSLLTCLQAIVGKGVLNIFGTYFLLWHAFLCLVI